MQNFDIPRRCRRCVLLILSIWRVYYKYGETEVWIGPTGFGMGTVSNFSIGHYTFDGVCKLKYVLEIQTDFILSS